MAAGVEIVTDHTPEPSRLAMLRFFLESEADALATPVNDDDDDAEWFAMGLEIWRETP